MAYFTAVLARSGSGWKTRDVEVDEATSLEDLVDSLRSAAIGEEPVVAVVEHEDEWFALVRVDGDDEVRLFVSDLGAASTGHYAELLAPAADVDVEDDEPEASAEADEDDEGEDEDGDEPDEVEIRAWAGDPELLEDLGVSGRTLRKLAEERGDDPAGVLVEIGETVGFADLLETLR